MGKKKKKQAPQTEEEHEDQIEKEEQVENKVQENSGADDTSDGESTQESKGKMLQRHKKEMKEMKKASEAILHKVPKGDKKAKEDAKAIVLRMEEELKAKHEQELQSLTSGTDENDSTSEQTKEGGEIGTEYSEEGKVTEKLSHVDLNANKSKMSKQKRRKAAKDAKDKERERKIAEEKKNTVNYREIEYQAIRKKLQAKGFTIKEIAPDGNCLYNAIADQLIVQGHPTSDKGDKDLFKKMRLLAATWMRDHSDDYLPFIPSENGDLITPEQFEHYCDKVQGTNEWGSQLEIQAIAHALSTPITVHTAQPNSPDIEMGQEYNSLNPTLHLSFHQHAYSLGEHYNSVVPMKKS